MKIEFRKRTLRGMVMERTVTIGRFRYEFNRHEGRRTIKLL